MQALVLLAPEVGGVTRFVLDEAVVAFGGSVGDPGAIRRGVGVGGGAVEHVAQVFFGLEARLDLPSVGPYVVQLGIEEGGLVFGEVFLVAT
ncbi:hypothetical protein OIU91_40380 [Streptomyces sp. NBC_01456]|uniref:hypothetical protein n=1 Tax=unclassified Streptomyces TaxID=2593676 RepID=UPI002E2F73EF|nr:MULTISPECIES: hypothetical protein [unclassified Streptomyces]